MHALVCADTYYAQRKRVTAKLACRVAALVVAASAVCLEK
jgi:hypothetical protein